MTVFIYCRRNIQHRLSMLDVIWSLFMIFQRMYGVRYKELRESSKCRLKLRWRVFFNMIKTIETAIVEISPTVIEKVLY